MSTADANTRKIDLSLMAYYRAWLQGMDLRRAADRYLSEGLDLREAKSTLKWMRETLIRAARRHGRMSYVRLLRIQIPNQARDEAPSPALPTLEDFRVERDPDYFYSEAELLEIYLAEYPDAQDAAKAPGEQRIDRLIKRQLEAINWAEAHVATAPLPTDSVVEWFDRPMAERLITNGLPTLQALIDRINALGPRWFAGIRQLGAIQAGRLVSWLKAHDESLPPIDENALLGPRALASRDHVRPARTDIMPLESFLVPTTLDGVQGENRYIGRSRIEAVNDYQAINAWLGAVSRNEHTRRSYRREAERLLLWAILERGKALSSLSVNDASAHQDWLYALGRTPEEYWRWKLPQTKWLGPRNTARWSPDWRPYEGALSLRSQQQSYVILKSLCEWLTKMRYLDSNPFDGVSKPTIEVQGASPDIELTHALSRAQWDFITSFLASQPDEPATMRLRFILAFAYATGLRLSELVDAKVGRLYAKERKSGMGLRWMLKVLGKGQKWRAVPMPSPVMHELAKYFASRTLPNPLTQLATIDPETPLIASLGEDGHTLSPSMLYKTLKRFFANVASEMRHQEHFEDAHKVAQASTHWLRHTRGSHSAEVMPLNMLQRLLGHVSLATTTIYASADEDELYEAMEKELAG